MVLFLFVTHAAPVIYCLLKGVIYMKCQRKLIGSCALSFGAGVLLSIFLPAVVMDRDGRGLHDKAAGTVVLRTRAARPFAG